jgi:hypothetical protein
LMLCTTLIYLHPINECVSRTFFCHVTLWVHVGPLNLLVCEEPIHNKSYIRTEEQPGDWLYRQDVAQRATIREREREFIPPGASA